MRGHLGILFRPPRRRVGLDVEAEEELDVVPQDVRGLGDARLPGRSTRRSRSRGQLLVVGLLSDAGRLDEVPDVPDRREDRVDRDQAQRPRPAACSLRPRRSPIPRPMRSSISKSASALSVAMCSSGLRISSSGLAFWMSPAVISARPLERDDDLVQFLVDQLHADLLQVQDHLGDVLDDARDGGKLMQDAVHPDGREGVPGERREQHAPHGVADGDAESLLQRLEDEAAERVRVARFVELDLFRHLKINSNHRV